MINEYNRVEAEMEKLEELAEKNLDLALQEMTILYFKASKVFNHEVCNAIDLWIYETKSPRFISYLKDRINNNDSESEQLKKWIGDDLQ
jgi:hypothetical protein